MGGEAGVWAALGSSRTKQGHCAAHGPARVSQPLGRARLGLCCPCAVTRTRCDAVGGALGRLLWVGAVRTQTWVVTAHHASALAASAVFRSACGTTVAAVAIAGRGRCCARGGEANTPACCGSGFRVKNARTTRFPRVARPRSASPSAGFPDTRLSGCAHPPPPTRPSCYQLCSDSRPASTTPQLLPP